MSSLADSQTDDRYFANVLLVCGPSGAGKSTFIDSMVGGRLPPELRSLIPQAAASWPSVLENDVRKGRVTPDQVASQGGDEAGVIFHYDTFFVHRSGAPDYSRDPISPHLLGTANLTIVNIKPTPGQLKAQFSGRHQATFVEGRQLRALWRHYVRGPFKRLRHRFLGIGKAATGDLYKQAGAIEECYKSWESYLAQLIRAREATRLVEIVPVGSDGDGKRFELLRSIQAPGDRRIGAIRSA